MAGPGEAEGALSQPLQLLLVLWSWAAISFGYITHSAHCHMMSSPCGTTCTQQCFTDTSHVGLGTYLSHDLILTSDTRTLFPNKVTF